jgi:hypothetical protein
MEKPNELNAAEGPSDVPPVTSSDQDLRQLKAEVSANQALVQDTVAAIQERLSPTHLKEQMTSAVRGATVERVQNTVDRAGETAEQIRHTTRQAALHVAATVRRNPLPYALVAIGAAGLLATTRWPRRRERDDDYDRTQDLTSAGLEATLRVNPVVLGMAAIAMGALVAAALRPTAVDERDVSQLTDIADPAEEVAHDAGERVADIGSSPL